ncbi:MAG: Rieske 2Fe-2S domain-containing protein [Candidatus Nitrosopolaris sp.]
MPNFEYRDSIYYFKRGEFKNYFQGIDDKSMLVSDALATFRESRHLPNKFKQMTVQQVVDDPELIREIYERLRKMQPQSKYKLPYKKEERQVELIENIAENYNIDKEHTQARIVTGHHQDEDTGREFNYLLEAVIAPRKDKDLKNAGEVDIIGNINSTPSIDGGEQYFQGGDYRWIDKKVNNMYNTSLRSMLHDCGFNRYLNTSKRKVPSVVYVNIKTPCPDWLGSAGKTHINMKPYQDELANTVTSLAYKIPTYHGMGHRAIIRYDHPVREKSAQDSLDDFLMERKRQIDRNPSLKTKDRITQRGVWYRIRPIMISEGFEPKENWGTTAKYIASLIKERCEKLFRLKREDLGIFASSRATMYYMGSHKPVNIDNFRDLARQGVAIIIIEKEGIADLLYTFADKYGVALVHTQGRFTEDGKDLIEAAKEYGSFVGILVDYDAVGSEIPKAARTTTSIIGINKETIRWLQQNRYEITLVEVATSVDVLIGKINYKMFACKNSCPHRAALLSKGQLKPSDNRIVCYMHCFEYNVFTGKLERIPNKWMNQSQGWKKSGELILYDVIENEDGSVFVDIAEEPINA